MIIHHRATPSSLRLLRGGQMDSFNPSLVHGGGPSNLAGCAQRAREIGGAPLPCLSSNISTEICSTQHRKAASALGWNVIALSKNMASRTLDSSP